MGLRNFPAKWRQLAACVGLAVISLTGPNPSAAQQLSVSGGWALQVPLVRTAQQMDMQDVYARALYLFIRANPAVMDDPQFYVSFVSFLLSTSGNRNCAEAFANEFERRDFFNQSFTLKDQLRQVLASVSIPQRFDVSYSVDTGRYDFTKGLLPLSGARTYETGLNQNISSNAQGYNAQSCASQMLNGANIELNRFPWNFNVINEKGETRTPEFPFGDSVQMPANDARILYERFGRRLYAIVNYQFLAANNGERKVQVIATDGQLFGLSDDAVVRVQTYAHPALSQPNYLDITNPLQIVVPMVELEADLLFQQQGFRAVGTGTREDAGTELTMSQTFPVSGSAAVGGSTFIMRLALPNFDHRNIRYSGQQPGGQQYMTLFGSVAFSRASAQAAPVSGTAIFLQVNAAGEMQEVNQTPFTGAFTPKAVTEAPPAADPSVSQTSPAAEPEAEPVAATE